MQGGRCQARKCQEQAKAGIRHQAKAGAPFPRQGTEHSTPPGVQEKGTKLVFVSESPRARCGTANPSHFESDWSRGPRRVCAFLLAHTLQHIKQSLPVLTAGQVVSKFSSVAPSLQCTKPQLTCISMQRRKPHTSQAWWRAQPEPGEQVTCATSGAASTLPPACLPPFSSLLWCDI